VFVGHGGDDVGDVFVRHRPEHPLADQWIGGADGAGCNERIGRGEDFGGRLDVESIDQRCESDAIQVMNGGQGSVELHGMAAIGGQVQVGPCHDILACARCQSG
jgi:hypothetical protein